MTTDAPETAGDLDDDRYVFVTGTRNIHLIEHAEECQVFHRDMPFSRTLSGCLYDDDSICQPCQRLERKQQKQEVPADVR